MVAAGLQVGKMLVFAVYITSQSSEIICWSQTGVRINRLAKHWVLSMQSIVSRPDRHISLAGLTLWKGILPCSARDRGGTDPWRCLSLFHGIKVTEDFS